MPRRILVLDDEQSTIIFLRASLELEGHQVLVASTGKEALALAACFKPDLIISDFLLREEDDGVDVVRRIRDLIPEIEALVVTAVPSEARQKADGMKIRAILEKPIEMDQLVSLIESFSIAA